MTHYAWLLPAVPAMAAAAGLAGPRRRTYARLLAVGAALATLALAVAVATGAGEATGTASIPWTPTGGINLALSTRIDGLAATVAVMVAAVAALVQIYSVGYLATDRRYPTYAAEVSLFTAAMLLVVVAGDLFELLVGWEVMGLCSYLLIGHDVASPTARAAAVKAFLVTRLGDVGFLFGIFAAGLGAGSFDIGAVTAAAAHAPAWAPVAALLLLVGVAGKSAQFPLHVWLPDAMAGPTPISALIHAATMVAAGVYLVARLYPVFAADPAVLTVLATVAMLTMLGAALAAFAERDLKRVLAWSTVSQLAYMLAGLAVGGWTAAGYHLVSHAAFKALLFLAAGCVLHATGTVDLDRLGGLARRMPLTFGAVLVGAAALAGLPPFDGALSKDAVLTAARQHGGSLGTAVFAVGLLTAFVTAAYTTRLVLRAFLGRPRADLPAHDPGLVMTAPLAVLAVAVVGLGVPALSGGYGVARWLGRPPGTQALEVAAGPVAVTTLVALAGALAAALLARRAVDGDPASALGRAGFVLRRAFGVDAAYDVAVVRPVVRLAAATLVTDRRRIDATVRGTARAAGLAGALLRRTQSGNVQAYLASLVVGALVVVASVSLAAVR